MRRVTVFLTEPQLAILEALTASTGLKFAEVVRRIVEAGLEGEWAQRRRQQDADTQEGDQ